MPFNLLESRTYMERAFDLFRAKQDRDGLFLSWADIVTTYISEFANFEPLDDWIQEIDSLLSRFSLPSTP